MKLTWTLWWYVYPVTIEDEEQVGYLIPSFMECYWISKKDIIVVKHNNKRYKCLILNKSNLLDAHKFSDTTYIIMFPFTEIDIVIELIKKVKQHIKAHNTFYQNNNSGPSRY